MFTIKYFRNTPPYRTLNIDKRIELETNNECPSCVGHLSILVSMTSKNDSKNIKIGICKNCGYVGYMDRPLKNWMVNFYKNEWDANQSIKTHKLAENQKYAVHLIKNLRLDQSSVKVCDIGCGAGVVLKEFENLGFKKLLGVENSAHRSEWVRNKLGYKIYTGNFENKNLISELAVSKPIEVLFSNHVLEHVYDLNEFMRGVSTLQENGNHFILSVPNFYNEAFATILFWLPHIHSFTAYSLECLLNRHGYEIVNHDQIYHGGNITILAQKTAKPTKKLPRDTNYIAKAVQKFNNDLLTDKLMPNQTYRYLWAKKFKHDDGTGNKSILKPILISNEHYDAFISYSSRIFYGLLRRTKIYKNTFAKERAFILYRTKSNTNIIPIKIMFNKNIQLIIK